LKRFVRPLFRFEVPPDLRPELFVEGREVFVSVEPHGKDGLVCGVFSIPTDVLKSNQNTLPTSFHQIQQVITNPAWVVSQAINDIFGKANNGNN
jgi:hypothetical protein